MHLCSTTPFCHDFSACQPCTECPETWGKLNLPSSKWWVSSIVSQQWGSWLIQNVDIGEVGSFLWLQLTTMSSFWHRFAGEVWKDLEIQTREAAEGYQPRLIGILVRGEKIRMLMSILPVKARHRNFQPETSSPLAFGLQVLVTTF